MLLVAKGRVINLDTGMVIAKNEYIKDMDKARTQILFYSLHDSKRIVWKDYDDAQKRDKVYNDLVFKLKKNQDVFEL